MKHFQQFLDELMTSTGGGIVGMHQSIAPNDGVTVAGREADRLAVKPRRKKKKSVSETYKKSGLGKWFAQSADDEPGWDRYGTDGQRLGKCGDAKEGEPYSACLSPEKAKKLGKDGIADFARRKRGAQKKAGDATKGGEEKKGQKPVRVDTGINEENDPNDPSLWKKAIAKAKSKFDVYPSAYANAWAAKWYKKNGGTWRVKESVVQLDEAIDAKGWIHPKKKKTISSNRMLPFHVGFLVERPSAFGITKQQIMDVIIRRIAADHDLDLSSPEDHDKAESEAKREWSLLLRGDIDIDREIEWLAMEKGWYRFVAGNFGEISGAKKPTERELKTMLEVMERDAIDPLRIGSLAISVYKKKKTRYGQSVSKTTEPADALDTEQISRILRGRRTGGKRTQIGSTMAMFRGEEVELDEVSPPGWEGTVKAMKKHKEIDNPWALAWYMKNKGYKSHKKNEEVELDEGVRTAFKGASKELRDFQNLLKTYDLRKDYLRLMKKLKEKESGHGIFLKIEIPDNEYRKRTNLGPAFSLSLEKISGEELGNEKVDVRGGTTYKRTLVAMTESVELEENTRDRFAGCDIFDVSTEDYQKCFRGRKKYSRWTKSLDMESIDNQAIRTYAHRNPGKPIIVRDKTYGTMSYLRSSGHGD